jgi:hypothetical protein
MSVTMLLFHPVLSIALEVQCSKLPEFLEENLVEHHYAWATNVVEHHYAWATNVVEHHYAWAT